jgi:hypothetical protein
MWNKKNMTTALATHASGNDAMTIGIFKICMADALRMAAMPVKCIAMMPVPIRMLRTQRGWWAGGSMHGRVRRACVHETGEGWCAGLGLGLG